VVEQEVTTQGITMSRRVEPVLVIRQKIIDLPRVKPTLIEGVPMAIRVKYSEPRLNQ
jgi:hypothetical protein